MAPSQINHTSAGQGFPTVGGSLYTPSAEYRDDPEFFGRHRYLGQRPENLSLATLDLNTFGAMQETLVDALHLVLLMEGDDDLCMRDVTLTYPKQLPPRYVLDCLGDYRAAPSYFRRDKARLDPTAPQKPTPSDDLPAAVRFAETVHRQDRNIGSQIGKWFQNIAWSEADATQRRIQEGMRQYDAKIGEYHALMKHYGSAEGLRRNAEHDARFQEDFSRIIIPLKRALGELPEFTLGVAGQRFTISNRQPLHPGFADSRPAQVLFAFRLAGKEGIDTDVHPLLGFHLLTDILGVESDLMLVMHHLSQHLEAATGKTFAFYTPRHREGLHKALTQHQRGLQLLYTFHQVAGRLSDLYTQPDQDIAFRDLETFLDLIGAQAELPALESPQEAALLLYAVARRLERQRVLQPRDRNLPRALRACAQDLAECPTLAGAPKRWAAREDFKHLLGQARRIAAAEQLSEIAPALALIERDVLAGPTPIGMSPGPKERSRLGEP